LLGKGDPRVYRFDRALIGTVKGPLHAAQGWSAVDYPWRPEFIEDRGCPVIGSTDTSWSHFRRNGILSCLFFKKIVPLVLDAFLHRNDPAPKTFSRTSRVLLWNSTLGNQVIRQESQI
jgi:hypothetical protein